MFEMYVVWLNFLLVLYRKGADELDLSSFKYGGMNVTGFSIKDPTYEENIQQSDCYSFSGLCPLNVRKIIKLNRKIYTSL